MAKDIKQFSVGITISGEVSPTLNKSVKQATSLLNKLDIKGQFQAMDKVYGKAFDSYWRGSLNAVKSVAKATVAVSGALIGVGAAATKAGMEYESAFAGVKKTVDATVEQFEILDKGIRDMSLRIPSSAVDIAGVMEVAGQLGITTDNLLAFTDTMIRLGVSTNLGADEAATSLAKFANITQMDPKNYEKLGSVIVDLGNNYATTEADIVSMATKMASTGDLLGLTKPQIMAVATAMSAVGIEAERGGSTMSKLLKKIQLAVETDPEQLKKYADVAGMSIADFSKLFGEDALAATSAFIEGIDDVERNGKSAVAILDDMGLNEIRLSNTILALAGGEDLLSGAIEMANKAWDENTALNEESEKRFGTTESKVQILKNSLTNLGIEGFYSIEGYVKDALDWASELIQKFTEYATGPQGLSKWIDWLKKNVPKVISNVRRFGKTVLDFLDPLFDIGKWMFNNPEFLGKAFIFLGTALSTYKIVTSLTKIVGAVTTLGSNPVIAGMTALMGVTAGIVTSIIQSKENFQYLVDMKLDEVFGDISLSMGDIEDVTKYLLDNGKLDELAESLKQFEEVSGIEEAIGSVVSDLNRMNWKVGIGIDLKPDEIETYQSDIEQFIEQSQDYISQQRYSVKISLDILGGNTWNSSEIQYKLSYVYNKYYSEMSSLGKDLSDAVNDAFADRILDVDEISKIADIQGKMAKIQEKLATSEYEAQMYLLGKEFKATDLTKDSYYNLQSSVADELAKTSDAYKETRKNAIANAYLMYDEGLIDDSMLNTLINDAWNSSLNQIAQLESKSADFLIDSVFEKVGGADIIDKFSSTAAELVNEYFNNPEYAWAWSNPDVTSGSVLFDEMTMALRDAMGISLDVASGAAQEIGEEFQPIYDMLQELTDDYERQGIDIPKFLQNTLDTVELFNMLANNKGDFVTDMVATAIQHNPEALSKLQTFVASLETQAYDLGENVIYKIWQGAQDYINAPVAKAPPVPSGVTIPGHATGGIFDIPHIAAFAEDGPEAAIPINGTRSAKKLWLQTGQLLGMRGAFDDVEIGGGSPAINYAPSLNFYGGTPSQNDITSALRVSKEEFAAMMDRYMKEKSRVAF